MSCGIAGPAPFPFARERAFTRLRPVGLDSPQAQLAGFILPNPEDSRYRAVSPAPGAPRLRPRGERAGSVRPAFFGIVKRQDAAQDAGTKATGPAARNRKKRGEEQWKN